MACVYQGLRELHLPISLSNAPCGEEVETSFEGESVVLESLGKSWKVLERDVFPSSDPVVAYATRKTVLILCVCEGL